MSEHADGYVYHENDPGVLLFVMPFLSREMRVNDTLTHISPSGSVQYKVESVDLQIEQFTGGHPNSRDYWRSPKVLYVVSTVP